MNRTAVVASGGIALLGFLLLATYVRQVRLEVTGGRPVEILLLRHDAQVGDPVTEELLAIGYLPEAYVESRHVTAVELHRVLGVRMGVDARANQALLWTDLMTEPREPNTLASRVPKGMRAIGITDTRVFDGLLRPGDRVDVLLTRSKGGPETTVVTVPLLQNLLVLSVAGSVEPMMEDRQRRGGVSLLVSVEQAALLVQAQQDGRLSLILRNESDVEIGNELGETTDKDVLEQEERARRQRRVRLEKVD